jgi:hypothetical protein
VEAEATTAPTIESPATVVESTSLQSIALLTSPKAEKATSGAQIAKSTKSKLKLDLEYMSPDTVVSSPQMFHDKFNKSIINKNNSQRNNTNNNTTIENTLSSSKTTKRTVEVEHEDANVNRMLMSLLTPEASSRRALTFDADSGYGSVLFPSLAEENRTYEKTIDMIIKNSNKSAVDKPILFGSAFESYGSTNLNSNNQYSNLINNVSSTLSRNNSENGLYDKDKPEPFYKKRTGKLAQLTVLTSSNTDLANQAVHSVESSPKRPRGGDIEMSNSPTMFYILTPHSSTAKSATTHENNISKWACN